MSSRPIFNKKVRRLRKLMRQKLPAYINLVDYLQLHGFVDTAGAARQLMIDGKVMVDSHSIGREALRYTNEHGDELIKWLPETRVKAEFRDRIIVRRS